MLLPDRSDESFKPKRVNIPVRSKNEGSWYTEQFVFYFARFFYFTLPLHLFILKDCYFTGCMRYFDLNNFKRRTVFELLRLFTQRHENRDLILPRILSANSLNIHTRVLRPCSQ